MPEDFNLEPTPAAPEATPAPEVTPEIKEMQDKLQEFEQGNKNLLDQLEQSNLRADRLTSIMADQSTRAEPTPPVVEPVVAPDPEADPEAYARHMIDTQINQALEKHLKPLQQTYATDRAVMLGTAEATAKNAVNATYNMGDLQREVETVMAGMSPELRANPQAWEQTYLSIKGKAAVQAEREAAAREAGATDGRGRPSASATPDGGLPNPTLSGPAGRISKFEKINEEDWAKYSAKSFSIDDFNAMKAKAAGGK